MTNVPSSYRNAFAHGVPAFEALDTITQQALLAGSEPGVGATVRPALQASSTTLAPLTVVALDVATGTVVKAVYGSIVDASQRLLGVTSYGATAGANNTTVRPEVFVTGNYNVGDDSPLVFDASFDTLAKKQSLTQYSPATLVFRSRRGTGTPGV